MYHVYLVLFSEHNRHSSYRLHIISDWQQLRLQTVRRVQLKQHLVIFAKCQTTLFLQQQITGTVKSQLKYMSQNLMS